MKILCCADIHMGRIPSVPHSENLSSHSAWYAVVEKALELAVDVLVLAGDVVEQEEHWFEAYGPLLLGLEKLGNAGIKVIGVGGNHDYSVFPSLAKESPHIQILGLGGEWEWYDYKGVRFIGWSFAERRVQRSPLDSFDKTMTDTDLGLLGLLHCDVGSAPYTSYAPVAAHAFGQTSVPLWVLGHIHKGGIIREGNAFYCGSPYALDSNEEGVHGPWLLEREGKGHWKEPLLIPLCPYRFETVVVSLEGAKDEEDVRRALTQSLRDFASQLPFRGTLLCSLVLVGTIDRALDIKGVLPEEKLESLWFEVGDWKVHPLARFTDRTDLDVDLEKLAEGVGATALLAKKLLDRDALAKMAEQYRQIEQESFSSPAFQHVDQKLAPKSEEEYIHLAAQAAKRLLFSMIRGEEGGPR